MMIKKGRMAPRHNKLWACPNSGRKFANRNQEKMWTRLIFIAFLVILVQPAAAQEEQQVPGQFFLSFSAQILPLHGDLDKELVLWHFDKAFYVPKLEKARALAAGFGYQSKYVFWEFFFLWSNPKADLQGKEGTAKFYAAEITGRAFLIRNFPLRPYLLLGLSTPVLTVKEGASMGGTLYNATYAGLGINLGSGLMLQLTPNFFLTAGPVYRYMALLYVVGGGKGRDIRDLRVGQNGPEWDTWLKATSLSLVFSVGFSL